MLSKQSNHVQGNGGTALEALATRRVFVAPQSPAALEALGLVCLFTRRAPVSTDGPQTAGIQAPPPVRLMRVLLGRRWRKRGTGGAGRWAAARKGFGRLSESLSESPSESLCESLCD